MRELTEKDKQKIARFHERVKEVGKDVALEEMHLETNRDLKMEEIASLKREDLQQCLTIKTYGLEGERSGIGAAEDTRTFDCFNLIIPMGAKVPDVLRRLKLVISALEDEDSRICAILTDKKIKGSINGLEEKFPLDRKDLNFNLKEFAKYLTFNHLFDSFDTLKRKYTPLNDKEKDELFHDECYNVYRFLKIADKEHFEYVFSKQRNDYIRRMKEYYGNVPFIKEIEEISDELSEELPTDWVKWALENKDLIK